MSREEHGTSPERARSGLRADCASCFGLCCVALPFAASADFAVDKEAGEPCTNLLSDFRCGIHAHLRERGFAGCTVFDCFGAGQQVSQVTFGGQDWRQRPESARRMFEVFPVVQQLHELLWYLDEALSLPHAASVHEDVRRARDEVERRTRDDAEALAALDVGGLREGVKPLLLRTSELVRAAAAPGGRNHRSDDLLGADLHGSDLRGADFRGALLIAADLADSDLRFADLLGADLRDTVLDDADLSESVFLTQRQVNAAKGNAGTALPEALDRPSHW